MCTCISKLQEKMVGRLHKNKKITKAEYVSAAIIFGEKSVNLKTTSSIELTLENAKKPVTQNIVHTYCPFCGEKYSES